MRVPIHNSPAERASRKPGAGCGILRAEPPREPFGNLNMARTRGIQKGYLHKQGNMWYVAFREDALDEAGQIVRVRRNVRIGSAKELSKREARRIADEEILNRVNAQAQQPGSLVTLQEFVAAHFKPEHVWALKHAGKLHYEYILGRHIIPAIGEMRLRDVTLDDVQRLVRLKVEAGLSIQTAQHIKNVISAVFSHARKRRAFHGDNPADGVKMPEMERKQRHALMFEQAKVLLEALPTPAKEMALLSITTSLNVAEMLALRWKWVNLADVTATAGDEILPARTLGVRENFYRGKFGSPKARSRKRNVPLSDGVVAALKALRATSRFQGPDDLVFASGDGTPLDETNLMRRVLKPAARALGMTWVSWHVFRHTHATLADRVGMAAVDRQAQMGHSDLRMTMLYTHQDLDRRRAGIQAIEEGLLPRAVQDGAAAELSNSDTK